MRKIILPVMFIVACAALCFGAAVTLGAAVPPPVPATKPTDPALIPVADNPALPRVLIIGDSISMGYVPPLRELLKSKANIQHPPINCGPTQRGLDQLDKWLNINNNTHWDVIHINFGLHDLVYKDAANKYVDPPAGKLTSTPEQYEKNLREIITRLKATNAKLIWANTTPVPDGTAGRLKGDEEPYNKVAEKVMADNNIPIDDLHTIIINHPDLQRPKNVHFTKEGYDALAKSVAASIEEALKK